MTNYDQCWKEDWRFRIGGDDPRLARDDVILIEQQFCHAASKARELVVRRRRSDIDFIFGHKEIVAT
jgi:hypothetical protein